MMKKLLTFFVVSMMVLAVSCKKQDGSTSSESSNERKILVGFSQIGAESDWRKASTVSIQEEAAKRGINLLFSDAQQKQENQLKAVRSFIAQGVDIICLAPVVATGWEDVLKEAKAAGIPVILIDRKVTVSEEGLYSCYIGSDCTEEGRKAARWVIENVGENAGIAELVGTVGSGPAIERKKGFEEIIKDHPGLKIIKSQSGDFTRSQGKEVMEQFMKSPEKDQIKVLYAHNDDMALGAIQAIEEAGKVPGKDIVIISCDGVKEMFKMILAGKANCTVECNPMIGPQLFDVIEAYIKEKKPIPPRVESIEGVFDSKNITQEVVDGRRY
ncbi:MAG: ABC transporter substrate-binding protein [Victivallales bacterium]|nr:ABC transporter substrate-binding protein [Victivallales bacterium]